jgi:hypothetical protein
LYLTPLTLIYEEGRHWQSSELWSLSSAPQLQEGPHLPRSGSRREYAEVKRRLREHPHVTLCCLQWALIDPVALLHALVTWSRLLCYLEILVL